jgi:beta-N-acetylhexosaminidase
VPLAPGVGNISGALSTAQFADTIVVFTQDALDTPGQAELVKALPPEKTVVVALRSPYDLLAFPDISTYMALYTPLPDALPVICDVLTGEVEPGGVLPVALEGLHDAGDGLRGFVSGN